MGSVGKGSKIQAQASGDLKGSIQWGHTDAWSPKTVSPHHVGPPRGAGQRPECSLLLGSDSENYMHSMNSLLQTHTHDAENTCKQFLVHTLSEIYPWAAGLEPLRNRKKCLITTVFLSSAVFAGNCPHEAASEGLADKGVPLSLIHI